MNLCENKVIINKGNKVVYDCGNTIIKAFDGENSKSAVFNEALNQSRVEETGLPIPKLVSVQNIEGKWCIEIEKQEGETLEALMEKNPKKIQEYMDILVDTQLAIHDKKSPLLSSLRSKYSRLINSNKKIDATVRYELQTRLNSMRKHEKVCHGDFNPSNVIVCKNGDVKVIDWAHATKGNGSADAAMTYLLFALKDQEKANLYMDTFCRKADVARQYVEKWLPIVAAAELSRNKPEQEEFLLASIDVIEYQ